MIVQFFDYKCKRCGAVMRVVRQATEAEATNAIVSFAMFPKDDVAQFTTIPRLDVHECNDMGLGIAEIIGVTFNSVDKTCRLHDSEENGHVIDMHITNDRPFVAWTDITNPGRKEISFAEGTTVEYVSHLPGGNINIRTQNGQELIAPAVAFPSLR